MVDQYRTFRELPLVGVLRALGVTTEWKSRKGGTEWSGPCPVCKPKKNRGNFSFAADGEMALLQLPGERSWSNRPDNGCRSVGVSGSGQCLGRFANGRSAQ